LSFFEGDRALWSLSVAVDLLLSKEATVYDVPRGSRVTFMIRRGLVEVSSTGTVTTDADIGSVAPVVVMPSGRSLLARLEDAHTAVMVDTP
jgi:DNA-binding IclR family transcriptional regulator